MTEYRKFAPAGADLSAEGSLAEGVALNKDFDPTDREQREVLIQSRPSHIGGVEWRLEVAKLGEMCVLADPANREAVFMGWKSGMGLLPQDSSDTLHK